MLVFGHAGLTLGIAALLTRLVISSHSTGNCEFRINTCCHRSANATKILNRDEIEQVSWVESLANYGDIRLLLVGSLLPDIIDKPVGQLFFRATFSNGRIFSHTILFLALISIIGFYLYQRHRKTWLLVLSFGTFTHLIFDQMWLTPHTLLWPLYGFAFERIEFTNWILKILHALFTNALAGIPEFAGIAILACFTILLVRRRRFFAFIRHGRV